MISIIFCSCGNEIGDDSVTKKADDSVTTANTENIKPSGSAVTSYESWKIYSYEYDGDSDSNERSTSKDETDSENELDLKYALFDCSGSTPEYVIDIDPLRCFFIDQYAYNIVYENLDNGCLYSVNKYDLKSETPEVYETSFGIRNHEGSFFNDYTIEKVLYWDDEYFYIDAKESNVNSSIHAFFSIKLETGRYRKIDERAIPYNLPEPNFNFIAEYIKDSVTAVDDIIGLNHLYGTITYNGFINSINIPLKRYEGRVDYNDFWDKASMSVDILPSGTFIRYIDVENDPKSYEKWKVNILDPLKNMDYYTVSDAVSYLKMLNNQASTISDYVKGISEHSTFWFRTYPDYRGDIYHDYNQSSIQSFSLTESGLKKTDYFDPSNLGLSGYFIIMPKYAGNNISENDVYMIDPDHESYVSAYPLQIKMDEL